MLYLKAYQAYQQSNYDHCLKLLNEIKQESIEKLDLQAQAHFKKKNYQQAYDIFTSLIAKCGDDTEERKENLLTVIVCSQLEQPGVLKLYKNDKLPTVEEIVEQVQIIDSIHDNGTNILASQEQQKKTKKHKKRKLRLPKQYDPVAGPDPERWLPRRDRKGNAHKQKKRRPRPPPGKGKGRLK